MSILKLPFSKNHLLILALNIAIAPWASISHASAVAEIPNKPFLSSVAGIFVAPEDYSHEEGTVTLHPERQIKYPFEVRNGLHYTYSLQEDPSAPVLFVIPGLGGTASSSNLLFLAEKAFEKGYSVVTIASTSHWSFALSSSTTGRTGYLPDDAADLYKVLLVIKNNLIYQQKIHPKKWGLLGYSYGALDGAFLMNHDSKLKLINFDFLVMLNPPLNRQEATAKIDQYLEHGNHWSVEKRKDLMTFAVGRTMELTQNHQKLESVTELTEAFPLKESALAWIMSAEFLRTIQNSAYIAETLAHKTPVSVEQSFQSSISDYILEKVLKPKSLLSHIPLDQIMAQNEISWALQGLPATKKVVVYHSLNDFLSYPEGNKASFLSQQRIMKRIYTYGGHLGTLSDPTFIKDLESTLSNFNY